MDGYHYCISIHNSSPDFTVNEDKIEYLAQQVCSLLQVDSSELNIQFVTEAEIQELNTNFRQIGQPTDVLSFPQIEWKSPLLLTNKLIKHTQKSKEAPPLLLGDIAINLNIAKENADSIGQGIDKETCFLLVHGILHLCGHDHIDKGEEAIMLKQQKGIMEYLDNLDEPPSWTNCVQEQGSK